ncbi:MAG: SPASM domain-containing protein [Candidatus Omnitrophota bacterium]
MVQVVRLFEGAEMDREKALEAAISQIERACGKGSIMRLGQNEQAVEVEAISSGSLGLDIALGTNGALLKEEKLPGLLKALTYLRFNISAADRTSYAKIMGCRGEDFNRVTALIRKCVEIKRKNRRAVTIGLQMVLLPSFAEQVIPLAKLGRELGVDYFVIKHCSDDEERSLGVDYDRYFGLIDLLKEAEGYSAPGYLVQAKWSKILSGGKRSYASCFGPPFILQMSGSGLVAPCGMLFNRKYKKYHIGNIAETPFKELFKSERYWEVMDLLASSAFDARSMCGTLCLQHKVNEFLYDLSRGTATLSKPAGKKPMHVNFI